ncbi:hypothetical protein PoB_005386900 [Plakobranchus ocellatus]|uniref:Uncharacterized protein n=1 Tax=Plakobranchus ocellatus TaxID=259542 RepID=A0AAV4C492_9GAST|nr:hypothetical protein PoB_005386900 [Plakobranchus ocellatus]
MMLCTQDYMIITSCITLSLSRRRGRQREKIMDGLATWLGPGKVSDILAAVKDRYLWRDMIAKLTSKALDDDDDVQ